MNSLRRKNQGLPAEEKYDIENETKNKEKEERNNYHRREREML